MVKNKAYILNQAFGKADTKKSSRGTFSEWLKQV